MTASNLKTMDLDKTFKVGGHAVKAVQKANLEGEPGELIAIMGPSGSGKTTLLSLVGYNCHLCERTFGLPDIDSVMEL